MGNPWGQAAESYGRDLDQYGAIQQQGMADRANAPMKLYQMFMEGFEKEAARKEMERRAALQQAQLERQNRIADETLRHNVDTEKYNRERLRGQDAKDARAKAIALFNNMNARVPGSRELLEQEFASAGITGVPIPSVELNPGGDALVGPVQPGQGPLVRQPWENELSGYGPDALEAKLKQDEIIRKDRASEEERSLSRQSLEQNRREALALRADLGQQGLDLRRDLGSVSSALVGSRMDEQRSKRDDAKAEKYAKDHASVVGAIDDLDLLASQAKKLLNHPGLSGITGKKTILGLYKLPGHDSFNAAQELETLKNKIAFGVLQKMRQESKTGGTLGNVSDAEGKRLESAIAALNIGMSEEEMRKNLDEIVFYVNKGKNRINTLFQEKHGGGAKSFSNIDSRGEPEQIPQRSGGDPSPQKPGLFEGQTASKPGSPKVWTWRGGKWN